MNGIDDDTYALMMKRVYDIAGTVRDVKVFMNSERLKVKNFKQVSFSICAKLMAVRRNVPQRLDSSCGRCCWWCYHC